MLNSCFLMLKRQRCLFWFDSLNKQKNVKDIFLRQKDNVVNLKR